jgi:hypothetical protein
MLIANFSSRKARCEEYVRSELVEVSTWGRDRSCMIWVANAPLIKVDVSDLIEEEEIPGRGWFPLELPLRLLRAYVERPAIVCDPFMGRGTVGKAARMLGHRFIGIDHNPDRIAKAKEYIGA